MKKVLFVSIGFPPKNDPECLQAGKYFKYLLRSGLNLEIVTSSIPTLFMPYDEALERYNPHNVNKVEIPIFETKLTNYVLRKILGGGIQYPDSKFSFYRQWKKAIRRIQNKPDVIYSRSNPISSALMAYKIQRYFKVPWVMHLSDPWVGSPSLVYSNKEFAFNKQCELECFENASRISFTTGKTLDFYKARYPEFGRKFFISPNVFDPEDASTTLLSFTGPLRIVYTGGLSGKRSPEFFLEACREVSKANPGLADFEIIFAGPTDRKARKIFDLCQLPFVKSVGEVSYSTALALQRQANILLTIDQRVAAHEADKAMFFPSKILDYFMAKRKILAITNVSSSTATILAPLNSFVVNYNQFDLLKNFLVTALVEYRKENASFFLADNFPQNFSADKNSLKLASILSSL